MSDAAPDCSSQTKLVRFFAFVCCALPAIFALECLLLVLAIPTFEAMFADFGWRFAIAAVAVGAAIIPALRYWRKGLGRDHVIVASVLGFFNCLLAQATLISLFLPIFTLGAVAGER